MGILAVFALCFICRVAVPRTRGSRVSCWMGLERKPASRAAAANTVDYERRRPEETTLYRLVQDHLETFLAEVKTGSVASLPQFVKDEFV